VVGAGEDADRVVRENLAQDLAHALAGVALDALGAGQQRRVRRQAEGGEFFRLRADRHGGHGEDHQRHAERLAVIGGGADVFRQRDVDVRYFGLRWSRLMPSTHLFDGNEHDRLEFRREQFGQRGAERAGTENGCGGEWGLHGE
jgi:hypothetical protein